MTRAFSYLRVSGKGQIDGDGFPRQRSAVKTYAGTAGLKIVHEYCEEGVTGDRETMDRPGWSAMMTALHADGVRTIIVEKLDRLSRQLMIQEATIADLVKHGFTLISVQEPDLMSTDPTRVAFRQMMGVFAQYDKSQIVLKLRAARVRKKAREGRCEGRKPFGARAGEHAALDTMRELRGQGLGYDAIARELNRSGVPTRTRGQWHGWAVNQILSRG
jgi:DNA invertase Pin-like site-specific DNA recombinase